MSYVVEVADLFLRRFPHIPVLGPEDYTTIADWEKREIPVEVVAQTFNEACASPAAASKIESIRDLHQPVKQHFREWLQQVPC